MSKSLCNFHTDVQAVRATGGGEFTGYFLYFLPDPPSILSLATVWP